MKMQRYVFCTKPGRIARPFALSEPLLERPDEKGIEQKKVHFARMNPV